MNSKEHVKSRLSHEFVDGFARIFFEEKVQKKEIPLQETLPTLIN